VALHRHDAEALGLDPGEDLPRVLRLDGVRLDDREVFSKLRSLLV
jgi:hypothetical protein